MSEPTQYAAQAVTGNNAEPEIGLHPIVPEAKPFMVQTSCCGLAMESLPVATQAEADELCAEWLAGGNAEHPRTAWVYSVQRVHN